MPRPTTILGFTISATFATGLALAVPQDQDNLRPAQPARPPAAAPAATAPSRPDPAEMQTLLGLWEGQSAKLKSLEVSIYRIDKDAAWGDEEHYQGHAAFRTPSLAYVDYRKVNLQTQPDPKVKGKKIFVPVEKKNGEIDSTPYETIICTGAEVWHYRYDVKRIIVYTLDRDARSARSRKDPSPSCST